MSRWSGPRGEVTPTSLRPWVRAGVLVVPIAVAAGAVAFLASAPSADCRTVSAAVTVISDRRALIADDRISAGPPLSDYVEWADTLKQYAASTSSPAVKPELDVIAERAQHAVGLVSLARSNPAGADSISQRGIAGGFAGDVSDIVDAEHRVLAACQLG